MQGLQRFLDKWTVEVA